MMDASLTHILLRGSFHLPADPPLSFAHPSNRKALGAGSQGLDPNSHPIIKLVNNSYRSSSLGFVLEHVADA